MRKIAFIVGQGGAGKTTLVNYFKKHPVDGWLFFDFDNGVENKPHTKDLSLLKPWVDKQRNFWEEEVRSPKYGDKNICLFGVGLFPWKLKKQQGIAFAYLDVDQNLRRDRLVNRGDLHLWEAYQKNVDDIVKRLNRFGARKINNSNRSIEKTANEIKSWLLSLPHPAPVAG